MVATRFCVAFTMKCWGGRSLIGEQDTQGALRTFMKRVAWLAGAGRESRYFATVCMEYIPPGNFGAFGSLLFFLQKIGFENLCLQKRMHAMLVSLMKVYV